MSERIGNQGEKTLLWVGGESDARERVADALGARWNVLSVDVAAPRRTTGTRGDGAGASGSVNDIDVTVRERIVETDPSAVVVAPVADQVPSDGIASDGDSLDGIASDGDSLDVIASDGDSLDGIASDGVPSAGVPSIISAIGNVADVPRFYFATEATDEELADVCAADPDGWFLGSDRWGARRLARAIEASIETDATTGTVADILPGIVFRRVPGPDWPVTSVSRGVEELTGRSPEVVLNGTVDWLSDVVYEPDADRVRGVVEDAIEVGDPYEVTYRIVTPEGTEPTPVREYGQAVFEGDDLRALEGFVADISEERERTERLATQRDRIRALHQSTVDLESCETVAQVYELLVTITEEVLEFDYCSVSVVEGNELERVTRTTDGPERYAGVKESRNVPIGEGLSGRAFDEHRAIVTPDLDVADTTNPHEPFRSAVTVPIGQYGVLQGFSTECGRFDRNDLDLAQVLVDHAVMALDGIAREAVLRERERELREQNERLEEFASVLSHDLRNPLTVARGWTELLDEETDSDAVPRIVDAHDRMEEIIEDVLALARDGEPVSEPETVAIGAVATLAWETSAVEDASLEVHEDRELEAEPNRLRRLLENLYTNAVDHGGTDVSVSVGATDRGFFVSDDGPGIPVDVREDVFKSGFSGEDGGTGFGLSIVESIVDAHGWSVSIGESETGGARFDFVVDQD